VGVVWRVYVVVRKSGRRRRRRRGNLPPLSICV
jgi:hypothetical protein